jgi:hypothetical protein
MVKFALATVVAAGSALAVSPVAHADRAEPPPLYGYYNVFIGTHLVPISATPIDPPPPPSR